MAVLRLGLLPIAKMVRFQLELWIGSLHVRLHHGAALISAGGVRTRTRSFSSLVAVSRRAVFLDMEHALLNDGYCACSAFAKVLCNGLALADQDLIDCRPSFWHRHSHCRSTLWSTSTRRSGAGPAWSMRT